MKLLKYNSLKLEQIAQKEEKRAHSVRYIVNRDYSGSYFPASLGCKTCCCVPFSDDPRMPVVNGDEILVTRWQK